MAPASLAAAAATLAASIGTAAGHGSLIWPYPRQSVDITDPRFAGGKRRARLHCRVIAPSLIHALYTGIANIFGASISEATTRPNPRQVARRALRLPLHERDQRPVRLGAELPVVQPGVHDRLQLHRPGRKR
jgi:hypothetical protein